jgi:hypothetical protein
MQEKVDEWEGAADNGIDEEEGDFLVKKLKSLGADLVD